MESSLYKVGAVILNHERQLLVVRKVFKDRVEFIIPGGKPEPQEDDERTLRRELLEELGVRVTTWLFFGQFTDQAIFENVPLVMNVYQVEIDGQPSPQSEIKECVWVDRQYQDKGYSLGSILSKYVIPTLITQGRM